MLEDGLALDLSTRNDNDFSKIEKYGMSSPKLMPPPSQLPKYKPSVQITQKIVTSPEANKLVLSPVSVPVYDNGRISTNNQNTLTGEKCSVTSNDVMCFTTNIGQLVPQKKALTRQQLNKKIYTSPGTITVKNNNKAYNKSHDRVTNDVKKMPPPLKLNKQHFSTKHMDLADLDVNSLDPPIRCSTPNPSLDGTILARHLDYSMDVEAAMKKEENEIPDGRQLGCEENSENDSKPQIKSSNEIRKSSSEAPIDPEVKQYCNSWVQKQAGVCTNNNDKAPTLYEPSIDLSKSLLDTTSISCNVPPPNPNIQKKKTGFNNFEKYKNTVFM